MRLVLAFGFNDTRLILIRCSFSVITSVITVWHMVSFTVGTLKTTHSVTVRFSFVSRRRWSSWAVVVSWCVVFHTDVTETEWLNTQMRSQTSLLKACAFLEIKQRFGHIHTLLTCCIKGHRTRLSELCHQIYLSLSLSASFADFHCVQHFRNVIKSDYI